MCGFERRVAAGLLKEDIPFPSVQPAALGMWPRLKSHLTNRLTWTGIFYVFLRFPLSNFCISWRILEYHSK